MRAFGWLPLLIALPLAAAPLSLPPLPTIVLTEAEIREVGATRLVEVLERIEGLDIYRLRVSEWFVGVRGDLRPLSQNVRLTIDGRAVNGHFYGGFSGEALLLSVAEIERIEIDLFPGGARHGPEGLSAEIRIYTKDPTPIRRSETWLAMGPPEKKFLQDFRLATLERGTTRHFGYTLSLGVELSRLFAATAEDLTFGSTDLEPLFSERQGLMNLTLHRRIGRSSLRISGGFGGGVVEMRDVGLVQTEIFDEVAGFVEGYGGIRWRLPQGPGLALDLALDGTWGKITEVVTGFSPQLPLFYRRFSFVLAEEVDLFAIPATLRVGLSLRRDFANSFAFDPEYETLPESGTPEALEQGDIIRREDSIAPFIEVRSNPLPPLWLDLALRNDYVPQSGQGIPALLAVVNADLSPTLTAYFLAGNGWRLPTFLERYNHPFETGVEDFRRRKNTIPRGDPDLIPEEVVGVEGGLHFQHFGGMGQLGLSLSLFGRWNRNFVVAIPDADPENVSGALFTNGGARKRMGSEAALSWQGRRFSWIRSRIGVSWRFDPGPVPEGTPAIGPRFVATGLLVLHPPLFPNTLRPTMSLLGRYTDTVLDRGERFSLSSRPFAPRHLLFDANFALTAPSRGRDGREAAEWEIGLHVADLFDERVAQAPFGDALERRILLTLRMIW